MLYFRCICKENRSLNELIITRTAKTLLCHYFVVRIILRHSLLFTHQSSLDDDDLHCTYLVACLLILVKDMAQVWSVGNPGWSL